MENYNVNDWVVETVADESILGSHDDTGRTYTEGAPQEIPAERAQGDYRQAEAMPGAGPAAAAGPSSMNLGSIPAEAVIEAGDKVISALTVMVLSWLDVTIVKKDVALTAAEKTSLEKPVENYLKTQNVTLTPGQALLLQISGIYVAKAISIYSNIEPRQQDENEIPDLNNIGPKPKPTTGKKRGPYKKTQK